MPSRPAGASRRAPIPRRRPAGTPTPTRTIRSPKSSRNPDDMDGDAQGATPRPIILITGASAGLGEALARELAHRRPAPTLVLVARRLERLDQLADELRAAQPGLHVETISTDLADPTAS